MTNVDARTMDFFDRQVICMMVEKYGLSEKDALQSFLRSETYTMLADKELEIYKMSPRIVFDMWESEKVTGDARNSQYLREDFK